MQKAEREWKQRLEDLQVLNMSCNCLCAQMECPSFIFCHFTPILTWQEAMDTVKTAAQARIERVQREKDDQLSSLRTEFDKKEAEHGADIKKLAEEKDELSAKLEKAASCLNAAEELKEARFVRSGLLETCRRLLVLRYIISLSCEDSLPQTNT